MSFSNHGHFQFLKRCRLISLLLIFVLVVISADGRIRRQIEIASFIQPTLSTRAEMRTYFRSQFRYGGGVVPRGRAEFLSPNNVKISASTLQLVLLNKAKLTNNQTDYDAIGIRWNGKVYALETPDNMLFPLMKFIERGKFIAYTIPIAGFDQTYFDENELIEVPDVGGYAAKEFASKIQAEFLGDVDVFTETEPMPADLEAKIIKDVTGNNTKFESYGSYVNADFHVKYKVFLSKTNNALVADVGGLPLRYHWRIAENGGAIIRKVDVFTFPDEELVEDLKFQDDAVMFFQTAAILRQFSVDNRKEFDRFLKEVGAAVQKP